MTHKSFRFLGMMVMLAASALACNFISQVTSRTGGIQETAQALATGVGEGQGLLATAQAVLTEDGSRLFSTAVAIATEQGSQFFGTAQAFVTQEGPGLIETAQALATEQGPAVKGTVQAFATEQGPELVATAQALATQIAIGTPQVPEDIPLIEGERKNLTSLLGMVAYSTSIPYNDVLAFYLAEMPANGWEIVGDGTYQIPNTAVLNYQKVDRKATVSLSVVDNQTYLLILIQNR